jgi:ferredoxin-NADP reductase
MRRSIRNAVEGFDLESPWRDAMPRFASRLLERRPVADGTLAFFLERPAGFEYTAGQYLTVTLPNAPYTDAKGESRTFSIASAPADADALCIATRMTGTAFKRSLAEVPLGIPLSLFGPAGTFTLPVDAGPPIVFIAGGIGITPFRSMLLDAVSRRLPHRITLLYSNRNTDGAAFHEELTDLAAAHAQLRYVPTMTQSETGQQPWIGERRSVGPALLREIVGEMTRPLFYIAGPPGLVGAATSAVREAGADPLRVVAEEFDGYQGQPAPAAAPASPRPRGFVRVASVGDLAPGEVKPLDVNGTKIALCNVDGVHYAIADACPHRGARLSNGELTGKEITCPLHGAVFDVTTGEAVDSPGGGNACCFPVRVSGTSIEVEP